MDESPDQTTNPLAIASLVLALVGVLVYCCGSFMCLGWVGILVWLAGAACGGIAVAQGVEGNNKVMAWAGLGLNLLFLVGLGALMVLGVGLSVFGQALQGM